ncbi:hypothetical protein BWQ96_02601 [Gracilariopsis chorda]|uniref:Mediator of RNA polymerase II transcription subunit 17 n=1 Tax=Gracilariopsis chorda TaxID=448386 RepID=A0A2V3IZN7_9FLOR|nr:hypothetical protein BWQ96_02601 [Gracilariopsis chorda]|eukprot:PXF47622.1 hypothetical protein BWQ96_02601 [Gracilariopsis chorda]
MSTPVETKRRKLSLQVSLEADADGRTPIQQVFPDGTFVPADNSHFERTSAIASAFVARALAAPPPTASSAETRATDTEVSTSWPSTVVTEVEGAIYELGRAINVIEALRANKPLLSLHRTVPRTRDGAVAQLSSSISRDGGAYLMAKKRALNKGADLLAERKKSLAKWIEADNAYVDAFLTLRKRCSGVRRAADGTPLIDVGDAEFAAVLRPLDPTELDADTGGTDERNKQTLRIQLPTPTYLSFGVNRIDEEYRTTPAPVVLEMGATAEDNSIKAIIRKVRLARVACFREKAFRYLAKTVAQTINDSEMTATAVGFEAGPHHMVHVEKTKLAGTAASVDVTIDSQYAEDISNIQQASMLNIMALHACVYDLKPHSKGRILEQMILASTGPALLSNTERVLDEAARMLRVRLEWTRGIHSPEEVRIRVYSTEADGDGPERALATIEPISNLNNCGDSRINGSVRITPAFGVIIPAPDDPTARGRALAAQTSSSAGSALGLDDVPRSYICPVGGEVLSVLTLLLCIRLLDALETAARASVEEMLDIDRQCFTVVVSSPKSGRTLKAKAWPKGECVGREVPGTTAWLDGRKVEGFPEEGYGRVREWRKLLKGL